MLTRRRRKQASYGLGFLGTIAILLTLVVLATRTPQAPPSATPTPVSATQPIVIEETTVIQHEDTVDIVIRLSNPNPRLGSSSYPVTISGLDGQGIEVLRHVETTYLLPGAVQYVLVLNQRPTRKLASVDIDIPQDPALIALPSTVTLPSFNTFNRERSIKEVGGRTLEEQRGLVGNNSTFDFDRVEVIALALDSTNKIVGASKTFLGRLTVGEQREFVVQWPVPATPTQRVVTLANTNIFLEENIIRAIGDPSQLR